MCTLEHRKRFEGGLTMSQLTEDKLRALIFEILSMERKNLRSKAKTDARMSEEIQKVVIEHSRKRF